MNDIVRPAFLSTEPPVPEPSGINSATQFKKSPDSPFPDGYSIELEEKDLRDLIESDDVDAVSLDPPEFDS
jgi:hypothetical protein